jgi:hypothetical protein
MSGLTPRPELIEAPVDARIGLALMHSGVSQVGQVGVLEDVNRTQVPFAEVVAAGSHDCRVLKQSVESVCVDGHFAMGDDDTRLGRKSEDRQNF